MMKTLLILTIMISSYLYANGMHTAKVLERMNSGGYTYMKVSEGGKNYWIAANQIAVKKGDKISFTQEMQMSNFHSKTLNRTFDNILFVSEVSGRGVAPKAQNIHVKNALAATLKKVKVSPFKQADTLSVAEVYEKAKNLQGQKIKVRGKVTKVSHMIMGKNWIHIQDGTGDEKSDDLVFTSKGSDAKAGDIVTAEGVVAVDKDFGYGYFYPVIIQESTFSK